MDLTSPNRTAPGAWYDGFMTVARTFVAAAPPYWLRTGIHLACRMAKKNEPVDELLDALVWMRRKAKKHQPVDDLIDALIKMRRKAKKKVAEQKKAKKRRAKSKSRAVR